MTAVALLATAAGSLAVLALPLQGATFNGANLRACCLVGQLSIRVVQVPNANRLTAVVGGSRSILTSRGMLLGNFRQPEFP